MVRRLPPAISDVADPEALAAALRRGAQGSLGEEASVELLVAQKSWLRREDFRFHMTWSDGTDGEAAVVRWPDVLEADPQGSTGEMNLLRIAAELASCPSGATLGQLVGGLDEKNTRLVLRAILHGTPARMAAPLMLEPM